MNSSLQGKWEPLKCKHCFGNYANADTPTFGICLNNIDKLLAEETGLPVHIADDPLACVAIGTGKALDQEETFSSILSEY